MFFRNLERSGKRNIGIMFDFVVFQKHFPSSAAFSYSQNQVNAHFTGRFFHTLAFFSGISQWKYTWIFGSDVDGESINWRWGLNAIGTHSHPIMELLSIFQFFTSHKPTPQTIFVGAREFKNNFFRLFLFTFPSSFPHFFSPSLHSFFLSQFFSSSWIVFHIFFYILTILFFLSSFPHTFFLTFFRSLFSFFAFLTLPHSLSQCGVCP